MYCMYNCYYYVLSSAKEPMVMYKTSVCHTISVCIAKFKQNFIQIQLYFLSFIKRVFADLALVLLLLSALYILCINTLIWPAKSIILCIFLYSWLNLFTAHFPLGWFQFCFTAVWSFTKGLTIIPGGYKIPF